MEMEAEVAILAMYLSSASCVFSSACEPESSEEKPEPEREARAAPMAARWLVRAAARFSASRSWI